MQNKHKLTFNVLAILTLLTAMAGLPSTLVQAKASSRPLLADGDYLWAKNWNAWYMGEKGGITIDSNDNVYTTGRFGGTVDFDPGPGTFNLTSTGFDIFVSKLDNNGNLVWAKNMGGSGPDAYTVVTTSNDIALDTNGNVYVTGKFCGMVDFDPGPGVTALTSKGSCDLYVVELDSNGNLIKARNMGGKYSEAEGYGIAVDATGNIYTTGHFTGTVDFDPGTSKANLTNAGQWDIFVSKLDLNGNYVLAKAMGGANADAQGLSVAVDSTGNIYTVGSLTGLVDFDPGSGVFSPFDCSYPGIRCGFLSKLDGNGNFVLAKQVASSAKDIVLDSGNNLLVTGSAAIVNSSLHNLSFPISTTDYIEIFKFDNNGNILWKNEIGTQPGYGSVGNGLAVDVSDNVYVTGYFSGTVDFDPGPGVYNLTSTGVDGFWDIFISKWDSDGNLVLVKGMGGDSFDSGDRIAVDIQGNMHTIGTFTGTVDFDPGPGVTNLTSHTNGYDFFVSKLDGDIIPPIFTDVPFSNWANSYIERLYNAGVTGGCSTNPLMYCPAVTVTRDQMAVFLLRGEHGSSYVPPTATGTMFADVPSTYWAADWIEQLANEGITGGCGNGNYCPSLPVTRDQMAVFPLRGEHGGSYTPPTATGTMFADVPSTHWAADWIEQLANEGITGGCGNGNYCPATPVTRDQMAVFLVRAFSLP